MGESGHLQLVFFSIHKFILQQKDGDININQCYPQLKNLKLVWKKALKLMKLMMVLKLIEITLFNLTNWLDEASTHKADLTNRPNNRKTY